MNKTRFFAAGLVVALAIGYVLVDRRSAYGVYHGIGKLTGARLDIGPVNFAELARRNTPNDALACPRSRCPSASQIGRPEPTICRLRRSSSA